LPSEQDANAAVANPDSVPTRFSVVLRELARIPEAEDGSGWDRLLAPGKSVGRYELVREIGRGGFGVVWEARDADLGRTVAFKAVRVAGPRSGAHEERLFREAEAAARLSHPNIVTLFDVGRGEAGAYLVLELLRGRTLAERLEQGPFSVAEALRIAVDVAKALAHAHGNGVVHRDLTPGNLFLCDEGHVKVLDLGMAHAFGRRRLEGGTPGYMAPEQRRGAPEDERTDVFALGVILHRMLAGELPFPDDARRSAPVPLFDVAGVPGLGELVARMLQEDPVKRPRDGREVLEALTGAQDAVQRTTSSGALPAARKRRRLSVQVAMGVAAGAAIALAAVCGGNAAGIWGTHHPAPDAAAPSIAVLPFADLSAARDKEYFSDGLADEILNALARVDGLRVPGRTSSFYFKGKSARLQDIGRELGVQTVLEGSVRTMGNRVRVTAQVVDVSDGHRIWGQTYDREVSDVFAVQSEIARAVVEALDVRLLVAKADSVGLHATDNPEVYAQYLVGRHEYHRLTREGYRLAVEAYEKALVLDPRYAPAWAGLGFPLFYLAGDAKTPAEFEARRRRALAAAEKAVELSPDLPDALSTRGALRGLIEYDWEGAKQDLERALALNGNDADTRRRYGTLLAQQGRVAEGMAELRKAVQLDPLGQSWGTLGALYQEGGELELSESAYQRHLQLVPGSAPGTFGYARTQLLQSKPAEALATIARCPAEDYKLWVEALAQHALGHGAESKAALDALTAKHAHTSALRIAEVYAWLGDKEAAFAWLDRALEEPGVAAPSLRTSPFLRSLRGDARFAPLLQRLRLPPI
jgi:eukaryotic-like serine/threonine-protein kinase